MARIRVRTVSELYYRVYALAKQNPAAVVSTADGKDVIIEDLCGPDEKLHEVIVTDDVEVPHHAYRV